MTARQIAMYVFRELTDLSYPAIAREFGGRDHTTVIHAVEKISRRCGPSGATYDQVTELVPDRSGPRHDDPGLWTTARTACGSRPLDPASTCGQPRRSAPHGPRHLSHPCGTLGIDRWDSRTPPDLGRSRVIPNPQPLPPLLRCEAQDDGRKRATA